MRSPLPGGATPAGPLPGAARGSIVRMPTVLRRGPYRFFFFSSDRAEPPHVHVERDENLAKFWLEPVRLHKSGGFRGAELNRVAALVGEHQALLLEAWREYFGE